MNIGALVISVIAFMIIGMLWYSPMLFGKQWQALTGLKPETVDKEKMNKMYGMSAFGFLIMVVVLHYLLVEFDVRSLKQAATFGFMAWLGFVFSSTFVNNLYQQKKFALTLIDTGFMLASILVASGIIYYMVLS